MHHLRHPIPAHKAAPFLASLVACGLIGRAEALAALLHAAAPASISVCGRRARLISPNPVPDNPGEIKRTQAALAARRALQPMLQARSSRRRLIAAAAKAARPSLCDQEIAALTDESIARYLRHLRNAKRQQIMSGEHR